MWILGYIATFIGGGAAGIGVGYWYLNRCLKELQAPEPKIEISIDTYADVHDLLETYARGGLLDINGVYELSVYRAGFIPRTATGKPHKLLEWTDSQKENSGKVDFIEIRPKHTRDGHAMHLTRSEVNAVISLRRGV